MKIVIHGTKGGYHIFTAERIPGFIDARPDYNKVAAIGQEAYAINFNNYNAVLSKYKIIRDVAGEKRMGNVAFSVIIPNNKKFVGADAKDLLDKLSTWYKVYLDGDNLNNVREDWSFVDSLTEEYKSKLKTIPADEIENIQQGSGEAAFVYYASDVELEKYLAEPYQQEYKRFKQIFFVKSDLEGQAENPLNALRHNPSSNLTGQIDLNNPWYTIKFNENTKSDVKIEVLANDLKCKNNDKLRRKSDLEISYTKPYYHGKTVTSKWDDINTEFVDMNDAAQTITIRETELSPKIQTIHIVVKNSKKGEIKDADVFCENYHTKEKKKVINNEVAFKAEELKGKWTIWGKKNNLTGLIDIMPESQPLNVELILSEHKTVRIMASDQANGDIINGFTIEISQKLRSRGNEIDFIGEDIYETWIITVSHNEYERKTFKYCAATDDNPKYVRLQKLPSSNGGGKNKKHYIVSAGKHGKLKDGNSYTSLRFDGHDVKDKIVPNRGYEFVRFELEEDKLTAKYIKKEPFYKNPKLIAACGGFLILAFSIIHYTLNKNNQSTEQRQENEDGSQKPKGLADEVSQYCNGIDLDENVLEKYKNNCLQEKPDYCAKINDALAIRSAINQGKIDQLKNAKYSPAQYEFKKALDSIKSKHIEKIKEAMTKPKSAVSTMNLNQVAIFITNLQDLLKIDIDRLMSVEKCDEKLKEIKALGLPEIEIVTGIKQKISKKRDKLSTPSVGQNNNTSTTSSTSGSSTSLPKGPKQSSLILTFWSLVHSLNADKTTYTNLLAQYEKNKNLTNDEKAIIDYLKKLCTDPEAFPKFKSIAKIIKNKAQKLTEISID